jgi:ribosome biogenesis GTPase / thiamine phosphate phosphatase
MTGPFRVVARYGSEIDVLRADDEVLRVHLRRRDDDVVCGDRVFLEQGKPVVASRDRRDNQLARRDGFSRRKTIAANIDRVWIVVAPEPETPRFLIDRFLVGIYNLPASPGILLNKCDLDDPGSGGTFASLNAYRGLGIPILEVSARTGFGLDGLRAAACDASNVLVGPSGVGKSSLIQALLPLENLRIGELGGTGEGRHTTTTARWYDTGEGGAWIDSPGVRDFSPEIEGMDGLARGFPDIEELATGCRFRNCSHRREPGCAVNQAVKDGTLPLSRIQAWLALLAGIPTAKGA